MNTPDSSEELQGSVTNPEQARAKRAATLVAAVFAGSLGDQYLDPVSGDHFPEVEYMARSLAKVQK